MLAQIPLTNTNFHSRLKGFKNMWICTSQVAVLWSHHRTFGICPAFFSFCQVCLRVAVCPLKRFSSLTLVMFFFATNLGSAASKKEKTWAVSFSQERDVGFATSTVKFLLCPFMVKIYSLKRLRILYRTIKELFFGNKQ